LGWLPEVKSAEPHTQPVIESAIAAAAAPVCTSVCTSKPESTSADTLTQLAAALQNLTPADRAKLAAMLTG
jgi:hypothetical protein